MINGPLAQALKSRGVSRRDFVKFCGSMASLLALPPRYASAVETALSQTTRPVLVWLEFQDCAGNSESMLRTSSPSVSDFVLELLSWEYHELIMAGAGKQAEEALERVMRDHKGQYLAVVEGACAWDGGLVRSNPNPTGAVGLQEAVPGVKIVNLGGCPHNPANTAAVLVHYLTFHELPALDQYNRPLFAYGNIIHDQCERRAHYDAGRFVEEWGDEGHRKGYCLYKMGCKGPEATYNCPTVRWNDGTSWPVKSGHGCIACASHRFWDTKSPFYSRVPSVPGFGVDVDAGKIGLWLTAGVATGLGLHGIASAARAQIRPRGEEPAGVTEIARGSGVLEREGPPEKKA